MSLSRESNSTPCMFDLFTSFADAVTTPNISICVCTCDRVAMLERLLRGIQQQETAGAFTYSVVIVDDEPSQSARPVAERWSRESTLGITYVMEPERNIAVARNTAVAHARGDFIAFIDDDEFPAAGWLLKLFRTC